MSLTVLLLPVCIVTLFQRTMITAPICVQVNVKLCKHVLLNLLTVNISDRHVMYDMDKCELSFHHCAMFKHAYSYSPYPVTCKYPPLSYTHYAHPMLSTLPQAPHIIHPTHTTHTPYSTHTPHTPHTPHPKIPFLKYINTQIHMTPSVKFVIKMK